MSHGFNTPPDSPSIDVLNHALKEWAIAIQALMDGETLVLLRKGGIREQQGRFEVQHRRVWLYPTHEHQRPEWLKSAYADRVQPVASGWHPERVTIQGWADITHVIQITEASAVEAMVPFHIWTESFAVERFKWKPRSPLYILLLRTYRLLSPYEIPYSSAYEGCKSWIDLEVPLNGTTASPVLTDEQYQTRVAKILEAIHPSSMDESVWMERAIAGS